MPGLGKRNPLTEEHFAGFEKAYLAEDRTKVEDERWSCLSREQIRAKGDNLDQGLIADEKYSSYDNLPDPIESAKEAIAKLEQAAALLYEVVKELKEAEEGQA